MTSTTEIDLDSFIANLETVDVKQREMVDMIVVHSINTASTEVPLENVYSYICPYCEEFKQLGTFKDGEFMGNYSVCDCTYRGLRLHATVIEQSEELEGLALSVMNLYKLVEQHKMSGLEIEKVVLVKI